MAAGGERWWARVPGSFWLLAAVAALTTGKLHVALRLAGLEPYAWPHLVNGGAALALFAWAACVSASRQIPLYLLLGLPLTAVAYADVLYFRQFGDLLSAATVRFAGQAGSVVGAAAALVRPADLWLWIDVPLLLLLWATVGRRVRWRPVPARRAAALSVAGAGVVCAFIALDPGLERLYHGHTMMARRAGLVAYHAMDLGSYFTRLSRRLSSSEAETREVRDWFAARPAPPAAPTFGVAAGRNLVVLQVESLHAFAVGLTIDGREVTPHLNRLRRESLYFSNLYTQIGQGVTADADLLVNCSLYPSATGAVYYDYAENAYRCLPTLLRENGYRASHAFQGIRPDYWNYAAMYPRVGFDRFHSEQDYDRSDEIFLGVSDASFLRQSVGKLAALPEPFHAFLVTLTSHTPYEHAPKVFDAGPYEGTDVGRYLNAVHYTDGAIGEFIENLRGSGSLDRSVLAVYGDHMGLWHEATGLRELFAEVPPSDEAGWWRIVRRVPLFVRLPGAQLAGERTEAAGQVDVAPTLAGLLGVRPADAFLMGRDLLAEPRGPVAFADGSALDDGRLWVAEGRCYGAARCDDLAAWAAERLRVSRTIVERDLVGRLREGDRVAARP